MYSQTTIIGRLGRDPEMRYTAEGTPVTSFSVAVDQGFGEKKVTIWYKVAAWRKLAETCNTYLTKGKLVLVTGSLRQPKPYQRKDGTWTAELELSAQEVRFLSGGSKTEGDAQDKPQGADLPDIEQEEINF
jgi:single-strand DNA-binding protein